MSDQVHALRSRAFSYTSFDEDNTVLSLSDKEELIKGSLKHKGGSHVVSASIQEEIPLTPNTHPYNQHAFPVHPTLTFCQEPAVWHFESTLKSNFWTCEVSSASNSTVSRFQQQKKVSLCIFTSNHNVFLVSTKYERTQLKQIILMHKNVVSYNSKLEKAQRGKKGERKMSVSRLDSDTDLMLGSVIHLFFWISYAICLFF